MITGCEKKGRTIGVLGDILLNYCAHHEDYGVRALNFLINSKFRYKLTNFLDERRKDMLKEGIPKMCSACNKNAEKYVRSKIKELEELEE